MPIPTHRRGLRLAALLLTLICTGCGSVQPWVADALIPSGLGGGPAVNSYHFVRLPFERVMTVSAWRVAEKHPAQPTQPLGTSASLGGATIDLVATTENRGRVLQRLQTSDGACKPLGESLRTALDQMAPLMHRWYRDAPMPTVELELIPPTASSAGYQVSFSSPARARMHLAYPLYENAGCDWNRYWSFEVVSTLVHELLHFHMKVNLGGPLEIVHEEFLAYATAECVFRQVVSLTEPRVIQFPGAERLTPARILELGESGKLPATVAGNYLAYQAWEAPNGARSRWHTHCEELLEKRPAPLAGFADATMPEAGTATGTATDNAR